MTIIEVGDEVGEELARRAKGSKVTKDQVLRILLGLGGVFDPTKASSRRHDTERNHSGLAEFVASAEFQHQQQAIDRFLTILSWIYSAHPAEFTRAAAAFKRGSRRYFSKNRDEIEKSGKSIKAKAIPASPFWVLPGLDNKDKRNILDDMLSALNYSRVDVDRVRAVIPDSNIRRRRVDVLESLGF